MLSNSIWRLKDIKLGNDLTQPQEKVGPKANALRNLWYEEQFELEAC
jgi:hypothetical protein